jgi:hypothetical protein
VKKRAWRTLFFLTFLLEGLGCLLLSIRVDVRGVLAFARGDGIRLRLCFKSDTPS